jgi:hypothetical protein
MIKIFNPVTEKEFGASMMSVNRQTGIMAIRMVNEGGAIL